ncbi:MAG: DUF3892 domain-containing protein [Caloramator sp.]|nr:DUF3892 domain-containing protein [Caloramator sp.]
MRITGIKHDKNGEIISYRLSTGQIISKGEGIKLAEQGQIEGVTVGVSKTAEKFLRSLPDGDSRNNLDNLPEIM